MKTAVVLSGGGARGDFQLGALCALEEKGIRPDIVCSTSVGSLNALMLTQGARGVEDLRRIWMGLRRNDHMWRFEDWWKEIDPVVQKMVIDAINGDKSGASTDFWSVRSSLLFGGGLGAIALGPMGFITGALAGATVSGAIQNITADTFKDVLSVLGTRAQAVLNLEPVRALMATHFNRDRFKDWVQSGKELRMAVVGLGSGELAYVTEKGDLMPRFGTKPLASGIDILDGAMASSAIAAVFPPVSFAGDAWVDGGHRENIPLRAALDAGATNVYVVCASPIDPVSSLNRTENGLVNPADFSRERILSIAERALLGIHLDELAAGDVYPALSSTTATVTLIAPRFPTHDIVSIDPEFVRANFHYGYRQAYDAIEGVNDDQRGMSDTLALNDGKITRFRRQVWHQLGVPMNANVSVLREQNASLRNGRVAAHLRDAGPITHEAFPCGHDLVPGDRMLPGQAIASPDGRFRLIYQTDGNLVLYRDDPGQSVALWATATDGKPLGVVVMQRDGNLVMYDEDVNALWASGTNGNDNHDARLRVQSDGNVIIHVGDRQVWETHTSQQTPGPVPGPGPVVRSFTMVNGSPMTIRVRYFKLDDTVMVVALPGGEFTLTPGQRVDWTFPLDVNAAKVVVNSRHELQADPGQTVTFSADDRLSLTNSSARAIDVGIFHDQDIAHVVALPGGRFRVEPNATSFWEFPADIERVDVIVNNRLFNTVKRGAQLDFSVERRVFVTNETGSSITARFYRIDDAWRWATLGGGDLTVQIGGTIEFEIPIDLTGVQVVLQGVRINAAPGDRLAFLGNRQVVLR
jgi:predicted acylesterase/phospholipase RssA